MARSQFHKFCGAVALVLVAGAAANDEERELSSTCPISGFNQRCKTKLQDGDGNCESGKKARCVLCSKCEDYSSGWCSVCANYGDRTEVSNKNHVTAGGLKSCLANSGLHVPNKCIKRSFRRLEEEDEEPSKVEERELSSTCPVSAFNQLCKTKLQDGDGNCESGKKARCVLCSKCEDYSSGWCSVCANYGDRTEVSNKNHVTAGGLKSCLANSGLHVPNKCIKRSFRRLEEEDEEPSKE